jgi:hypothetical protein
MKRAIAVCAAALALVATGCGSSAGTGSTGPAAIAPAGTIAYASFEFSPDGAEKEDFDAAFGKLLGAEPETKLKRAFADGIKESGSKLDFEKDVEPWLGDVAAAVVTGVGPDGPDYAVLVASKDDDEARDAIDKDLAGRGSQQREYHGSEYRLLDDGTANGVVDHFLVAGTHAAFKAVVDADGGKSLADSEGWKKSVGDRADGKVGLAWVDVKAALQAFAPQLPGAQRVATPLLLGLVRLHPFVATLDANPNALVVDVSSPGTPPDKRGVAARSSSLIENLPSDAWAALAVPQLGEALGMVANGLKLNPLMAQQYATVTRELRRSTGLDLERDILAGIGDVGFFVRGTSVPTLAGGAIIEAARPAALRRTIARLPALIARSGDAKVRPRGTGFDVTAREVPQPIQVRMREGRAAAAYGRGALRSALAPTETLGGTDTFRKAAAAVGARPVLFASFAQIAELVRSSPEKDPEVARALEHLDRMEYAAIGARRDGGLDTIRAVLGLR